MDIPWRQIRRDLLLLLAAGVGLGGLVGGVIGWLTYPEEHGE